MRQDFVGYYAPTDEEYRHIWEVGTIVLDTNVMLDLYRLPATAREELTAVLEIVKDRLWIPYQVALEFQRRRLSVIADERSATQNALNEVNGLFEKVTSKVASLQIDKRGLDIDSEPIIKEIGEVT